MADEVDEILVTVYINKEFEAMENIDSSKDEYEVVYVDRDEILLSELRDSIKNEFRRSKTIKPLFKNKCYEWKIYSYEPDKAGVEIEDNDDLETEIEEFCPSDQESNDESNDNLNDKDSKYLKLRVIFFKSYVLISKCYSFYHLLMFKW